MGILAQSLVDATSSGAIVALAALGIGLIFGVLGIVNFAHAELITASGYALILLWPYSPVLAVLVAALAPVVLSLLFDLLVFRRMRSASGVSLLIVSFAMSFAVQRVYLLLFGADARSGAVAHHLDAHTELLGLRIPILSVVSIAGVAVLLLAVHLFLKYAGIGIQIRAAAADFATARMLGVRAGLVISVTFAMSGLLAAVVGFVLVTDTGVVAPTLGVDITVLALVGAVIGGFRKLHGAVIGGFAIGFVTSQLTTWLPPTLANFREVYAFVLVIIILLWRPNGLLDRSPTLERA